MIYPERVRRKDALRVLVEVPVHAAYERPDFPGSVRTACGRVLWEPWSVEPETAVTCRPCLRSMEPYVDVVT